MIIVRTPLRISFAGGGTDLPGYYKKFEGKVISTTINKFIYIIIKKQVGFVEYKYRINWSKSEFKNNINKIENPIAREILKLFKINFPIEITTFSDIPAQTGLGSSSAFAVGLINGISKLLKKNLTKKKIAELAFKIEVKILKRKIGKQDHYATSYGGLNKYIFKKNEKVIVKKIKIKKKFITKFQKSCILLFTNQTRNAHDVLKKQANPKKKQIIEFQKMKKEIFEFERFFKNSLFDPKRFGFLLDRQWNFKKKINKLVRSDYLDKVYKKSLKKGSYGGKLLGAGNGGFYLFSCNNFAISKITNIFGSENIIKFELESSGSKVMFKKN